MEKPFYKSLKFWYAVGGIVAVFIGHFAGLSIEELGLIAVAGAALIGGQAASDVGKHAKAIEAEAASRADTMKLITSLLGGDNTTLSTFSPESAEKIRTFVDDLTATMKKG